MLAAVLVAASLVCLFFSSALAAEPGDVTLEIEQVFTNLGISLPPGDTFNYNLTASLLTNPMPSGSVAGVYTFSISGTDNEEIDISFTQAGIYMYELSLVTLPGPGYALDQTDYTLSIYVEHDLTTTVNVHQTGGSKVDTIRYDHTYDYEGRLIPSDPSVMVDPPIVKTVSGTPLTPGVFTFRLVAADPSYPMPAGSVGGVKTIQITGSGTADFGTWSYTATGVYYYTVYEVNSGVSGYTYDTVVYTIVDTVSDEDGQLVVSRVVTNELNRPVTSLTFLNVYTGSGTPTPPPGTNNGDGPKTGDDSAVTFYIALLLIACVAALVSGGYLLVDRRYNHEREKA